MEKFKKLGLGKETLRVISSLDFKEPSEIQEKTIPLAIKGRDIVASSKTGSGKTLAFAAPILENLKPNNTIQALVLTPTRELADQVGKSISVFSEGRLNILEIYGGVDIQRQMRKLSRADVVVGTPGRILDHLNRRTINLTNVKILVLDEFDRMLDMGFSKDVDSIIRECPKERQTMLFSATMSSGIDHLVDKYTKKDAAEIEVESFLDTSKLKQVFYDTPSNMKFSLLVHLLNNEKSGLVMVFCNTRRQADFIVSNLGKLNIEAKAIHGGLEQKKRIRVLEEFHGKGANILVCTDVAARGLDVKGVSHVYNYDIPKEVDDYIHRIGRTARAGTTGKAINILSSRDYESFSDIERHESLNVEKLDLPKIQIVRVKAEERKGFESRGRDSGRGQSGGRNFSRGPNRGRSSSSQGSRFSNNRRSSGEGTDKYSANKSFGNKSFGDRNSSRGPRRDSGKSFGNKSFGDRDSSRAPRSNSRPSQGSSSYKGSSSPRSRDSSRAPRTNLRQSPGRGPKRDSKRDNRR